MTEARTDTALGLGERLRSARRARAMTLEQVSQALRIEAPVLRALEENRFEELGAPVFVRGHLKAYARLLGLSEDTVLAAYRAAVPDSERPPRVARERERPITAGPGAGSVVTLLLVVLGLIALFWLMREEPAAPVTEALIESPADALPATLPLPGGSVQDAESSPEVSATPDAAPAQAGTTPPASSSPAESPAASLAAPLAASPAGGPPADALPPGRRRLTLEFIENAWVEISDRGGRLLAGEQPAGARHELSGEPPFDIVLGNREGVRLSLDGVPVSYPGGDTGRRVARFRLPAADAEDGDG